jgi:hypothetical protein
MVKYTIELQTFLYDSHMKKKSYKRFCLESFKKDMSLLVKIGMWDWNVLSNTVYGIHRDDSRMEFYSMDYALASTSQIWYFHGGKNVTAYKVAWQHNQHMTCGHNPVDHSPQLLHK